ncbi:MAG: hypothetical protein M1822_002575 [Bathelium mastoideum]|nr:MAG: hypothetical protein M1822_002575 [Bathelium mastoideum]
MSETVAQDIHYTQLQINWSIALLVLSIAFTILRFISQWRAREDLPYFHWVGWDDILILFGLASNIVMAAGWIALSVATINLLQPGASQAQVDSNTIISGKGAYIGAVFYCLATAFPKLSICALYLRIFVTPRLTTITWIVIAFLVANCIAFTVASILICTPPSYFWTVYIFGAQDPEHKCIKTAALTLGYNPPHIVTDLIMLVLPIRALWRLNIDRSKRIGLIITFSMGSLGLAGSVARWAVYLYGSPSYRAQTIGTILSLVEPTMYLIAACLPPMRSLISRGQIALRASPVHSIAATWTSHKMSTLRANSSSKNLTPQASGDDSPITHNYRKQTSEEFAELPPELLDRYHSFEQKWPK